MLAEATGAETDRAGRIAVLPDLTLPGHPEVFAVGDMVALDELPGVAEVAMQSGIHAANTIVRAAWIPDCIATSATPGSLSSAIMSPMTKTSGCPAIEQSGRPRSGLPGRVRPRRRSASIAGQRRGRDAGCPDHSWRRLAARLRRLLDDDAVRIDVRDDRAAADLDARRPSSLVALPERRSPNVARISLPPSNRTTALCGVEARKLLPQRPAGQLGDLAGDLDPGRPAPDDDERQPRLPRSGRRSSLGHLEGAEDAPAQLQRVVERLHARRVIGELVVAEVRLPRAGGHDQAVVGQLDGRPSGAVGVTTRARRGRRR